MSSVASYSFQAKKVVVAAISGMEFYVFNCNIQFVMQLKPIVLTFFSSIIG